MWMEYLIERSDQMRGNNWAALTLRTDAKAVNKIIETSGVANGPPQLESPRSFLAQRSYEV
jgi:hypothetical protein